MNKFAFIIPIILLFVGCKQQPTVTTTKVSAIGLLHEKNENGEIEIVFKELDDHYVTVCYVNDTLFLQPNFEIDNPSISICEKKLNYDCESNYPLEDLNRIYYYSNYQIKKDANGDMYITSKEFSYYQNDKRELSSFSAIVIEKVGWHFRINMSVFNSTLKAKSKFD